MRVVNGLVHWRRYRTRGLIRLWDKDFTLIGQQRTKETVEPWWRWARRLAAEIAAVILRRTHRQPTYATIDHDRTVIRRA